MNTATKFLNSRLEERKENGLIRKLTYHQLPFDFCSNDYLGFARSQRLKNLIDEEVHLAPTYTNGAGGSRLLSGNHPQTEVTEQTIATFHEAEAGLIFNSGYDANIGLLSSIPQRGDTIITDELIHASLIDGARLSHAERYKFRHNDLNDLEAKLKAAKGIIYVVVESVYSMDGDVAPLNALAVLCRRFNANLIVDEAHATGIFGDQGKGMVVALGLQQHVFARIITFGKAIGIHGAIVIGSRDLRDYLINFARSFIYTTAAPLHQIIAINCAYRFLSENNFQSEIHQKIKLYQQLSKNVLDQKASNSTIQTIMFEDASTVKQAASILQNTGFDVRAILSPTVAAGKERLRICLHTFNSDQEIETLFDHLKKI